jgi:hypothetical protein
MTHCISRSLTMIQTTVRNVSLFTLLGVGLAACGTDNALNPSSDGQTYLRFVNSTYQEGDPVPGGSGTDTEGRHDTTYVTYTAAPIDILIDSALTGPSDLAIPPNTVDTGSTGPAPSRSAAARYRPTSVGVHSFVARVSGLSPAGPTLFTTPSNTQYLPQQFLTNTSYYTFAIAGINPPQPTTGAPVLASSTAFMTWLFPLLVDDPFTPPATKQSNGTRILQARFRVHHYAPFGNLRGTSEDFQVFLTEGSGAADVSNLAPTGWLAYRNATQYINVAAGTYRLTIMAGGIQVYSAPITFAEGDVRSLFVLNAMPSYTVTRTVLIPPGQSPDSPVTTAPSPTFQVTDVQDNRYTL